jgi:hypothetical protein
LRLEPGNPTSRFHAVALPSAGLLAFAALR